MLKLSFADQIEYRRLTGRETLVDTPPDCAQLWEKGKAAGFHLGRLYVVSGRRVAQGERRRMVAPAPKPGLTRSFANQLAARTGPRRSTHT